MGEMNMAGQLSQSDRIAEFKTPLGKDALVLIKITATEGLGELFEFRVEALSDKENIDFDKALGQGCTIKLNAYEGKDRIYDGILTQAQWIGKTEDFHHYKLVLRPWLWLLGPMVRAGWTVAPDSSASKRESPSPAVSDGPRNSSRGAAAKPPGRRPITAG